MAKEADFIVTVNWKAFVTKLKDLADISKAHAHEVETGQNLLDRIQNQDLPAEYIIDIPLYAFQNAYELIGENQTSDPVAEAARFMLDEDGWAGLLRKLWNTKNQCDPSIGGEFL